jgi:hypothetical protein
MQNVSEWHSSNYSNQTGTELEQSQNRVRTERPEQNSGEIAETRSVWCALGVRYLHIHGVFPEPEGQYWPISRPIVVWFAVDSSGG